MKTFRDLSVSYLVKMAREAARKDIKSSDLTPLQTLKIFLKKKKVKINLDKIMILLCSF